MSRIISYWQVDVFPRDMVCSGVDSIKGYQQDPDPEFNNGFLIIRDKSGDNLKALNANDIAGFNITPIYADEK